MIFFSSVPDGSLVRDIRIKNNYIISGMIHKSAAHGSRKKSVSFSTSFAYILSLYALLPFIVSALLLRLLHSSDVVVAYDRHRTLLNNTWFQLS